jgi:hypothetical protein
VLHLELLHSTGVAFGVRAPPITLVQALAGTALLQWTPSCNTAIS